MEILPGVYSVASFIISITDWMKFQPCLNKNGYRYQLIKKEDCNDNLVLILVFKVTELADQKTTEVMNEYI